MGQSTAQAAFLGIGLMGSRMARNLLAAGHPLTVWNRSKSKADSLASQGAIVTNSAAEAVSGARTIITMLANGPIVDSVLFGAEGAAPNIAAGALVIDKGTLAIMAGGTPAAFERATPIFTALGRATLVGPAGSGQLAKLANQAIVAVTIGAVAEALLLAAAGGRIRRRCGRRSWAALPIRVC